MCVYIYIYMSHVYSLAQKVQYVCRHIRARTCTHAPIRTHARAFLL